MNPVLEVIRHRWLLISGAVHMSYRVTNDENDPSPEWVYSAGDVANRRGASMKFDERGTLRVLRADGTCHRDPVPFVEAASRSIAESWSELFRVELHRQCGAEKGQTIEIVGVDR